MQDEEKEENDFGTSERIIVEESNLKIEVPQDDFSLTVTYLEVKNLKTILI